MLSRSIICSVPPRTILSKQSPPCIVKVFNCDWPSAGSYTGQSKALSCLVPSSKAKKQVVEKKDLQLKQRDQRRHISMAMKKSDYLSDVWKDGIFSKPHHLNSCFKHGCSSFQMTKSSSVPAVTAASAVPKSEQWSTSEPMPASSAETSRRPSPWLNPS